MKVPVAIPRGMIIQRIVLRYPPLNEGDPDMVVWIQDFSPGMEILVPRTGRPLFLEAQGVMVEENGESGVEERRSPRAQGVSLMPDPQRLPEPLTPEVMARAIVRRGSFMEHSREFPEALVAHLNAEHGYTIPTDRLLSAFALSRLAAEHESKHQ